MEAWIMLTHTRRGFAAAILFALVAAPAAAQTQTLPASDPRAQSLQLLGEAYAKDLGLTLAKAEVSVAGTVSGDPTVWTRRLVDALAVGYRPTTPSTFRVVPFAILKPIMNVKMSGGRSPEDTVARVVAAGNTIAAVTWYFTGANPVKSYAVFSPSGASLFDTMLMMPAIQGPVLSIGHGSRE
jgi:hypothetical protein